MSPLSLLPDSLPNVSCLYLYANTCRVKIGRTKDLRTRAKVYERCRMNPLTCIAYVRVPLVDLNRAEMRLIEAFVNRFPPAHSHKTEWFLADRCEAYALFEDVALELLESVSQE